MHLAPVLSAADGFEMIYFSAIGYLPNDEIFFTQSICWNDQRNVLTYRFMLGIAKGFFSCLIPTGNNALQCFTEDHIIRCSNDGSQNGLLFISDTTIADVTGDF